MAKTVKVGDKVRFLSMTGYTVMGEVDSVRTTDVAWKTFVHVLGDDGMHYEFVPALKASLEVLRSPWENVAHYEKKRLIDNA